VIGAGRAPQARIVPHRRASVQWAAVLRDKEGLRQARATSARIGRPNDIAPAAVFLASPDSRWITGETLVVAGGLR